MQITILSFELPLIGFNFYAQQLAFPTPEGYGIFTDGGRGGDVSLRIASPSIRDKAADYGKWYVGGWSELKSTKAPKDSDHDGLPDERGKKNGLNPRNAADRNTFANNGYTMPEKYLNSID